MARNFEVEKLEQQMIQDIYNDKVTKNDIVVTAKTIMGKLSKDVHRAEMLTRHILKSEDYPMNNYTKTTKDVNLGTHDGNQLIRKVITYTNREDPRDIIKIFEQNWFAGYGAYLDGVGYVGLMED